MRERSRRHLRARRAVVQAVMVLDLFGATVADPDLEGQQLTSGRALGELERVPNGPLCRRERVITRLGPFQAKILAACGIDPSASRSRASPCRA
ncbi:MAG: hypothetical protein ABSG36_01475 [Acidimicrobiales bacterium]